jgi:hypothetical protein
MAGKKFHLTPDGPKRCTATFRACPFADHFQTVESAIAADRIIQRNNIHRAELKRLHDNHKNPDPKLFSRTSFNFGKGSTSPRKFAEEIDNRIETIGVKPEIYHSMGQFKMDNGNGMEVTVQVMRMTEVDEGLARYNGVWRIIQKANQYGLHHIPDTVQDVVFDFSDKQRARRSMLQAREFFRTAAISSGIYDEEVADHTADEMSEDFKNMFNAVESDAAGDYDLYERGMGYFTESTGQTIVVNENFKTSAFRVENFRNFLSQNPSYKAHQPTAEIRVTDRHSNTGASWTIKKEQGQWAVEKLYADGRFEVINIETPQDALDHVYYHSLSEVNPDNTDEALRKGRYAGALMTGVESALNENMNAIQKWWDDQDARKAASSGGNVTKEMYDLGEEPKGSLMGKIFETFT